MKVLYISLIILLVSKWCSLNNEFVAREFDENAEYTTTEGFKESVLNASVIEISTNLTPTIEDNVIETTTNTPNSFTHGTTFTSTVRTFNETSRGETSSMLENSQFEASESESTNQFVTPSATIATSSTNSARFESENNKLETTDRIVVSSSTNEESQKETSENSFVTESVDNEGETTTSENESTTSITTIPSTNSDSPTSTPSTTTGTISPCSGGKIFVVHNYYHRIFHT